VAAHFVANADILCFSLLSGGELPRSLTQWIERILLDGRQHRTALFALVEAGGRRLPQLSRAEIYLSRLSATAGVDCLCYSDSIPIARAIRNKKQDSRLRKSAKLAISAPRPGGQNNSEFSGEFLLDSFLISSRRQPAQPLGR
jgi:hypothetical protein